MSGFVGGSGSGASTKAVKLTRTTSLSLTSQASTLTTVTNYDIVTNNDGMTVDAAADTHAQDKGAMVTLICTNDGTWQAISLITTSNWSVGR